MSENDSQERTESPTPKRLEDARKKGQVPRSIDLGAAAVTLAATGALFMFGASAAEGLMRMLVDGLQVRGSELAQDDVMLRQLGDSGSLALMAIVPLFAAMFVAAVASPALIGGWTFSSEALSFKPERLDPVRGIGRMFSVRSVVELLKSIAKFALIAGIAVLVIRSQLAEIGALAAQSVGPAIVEAGRITLYALLAMAAGLGIIAAIDAPFQLWQHTKELRMSMQEIREEMKESEGSPETRSRIRQMQQTLARRRMLQDVPKANVVITNPTHYAVALRYDEKQDLAPVVLAKGSDEIAARIREIAREHGVPMVSAPPLARAIFRHVDIGRQIPHALFVAVAQVLTYVWQLKVARRQGQPPPPPPAVDPAVEQAVTGREA
ncbi:MAG: flagellar biosynthesis protein FlhB [Gammaproteobacteria bacterium]